MKSEKEFCQLDVEANDTDILSPGYFDARHYTENEYFIGGLQPVPVKAELKQYFSQFGVVKELRLAFTEEKRFRGFAFISFRSIMPEVNLLLISHYFKGHLLKVSRAMTKESSKMIRNSEKVRKIYVGDLDVNTCEQEILFYFSDFGKVEAVKLIRDKITQKSKEYAFVLFESRESAIYAVQTTVKHQIGGKAVTVQTSKCAGEVTVATNSTDCLPVSKPNMCVPVKQVSRVNQKALAQAEMGPDLKTKKRAMRSKPLKMQPEEPVFGTFIEIGPTKKQPRNRPSKQKRKNQDECSKRTNWTQTQHQLWTIPRGCSPHVAMSPHMPQASTYIPHPSRIAGYQDLRHGFYHGYETFWAYHGNPYHYELQSSALKTLNGSFVKHIQQDQVEPVDEFLVHLDQSDSQSTLDLLGYCFNPTTDGSIGSQVSSLDASATEDDPSDSLVGLFPGLVDGAEDKKQYQADPVTGKPGEFTFKQERFQNLANQKPAQQPSPQRILAQSKCSM